SEGTRRMPCEVYAQLQHEWKSAQQEWAYFAYPQNKVFRGVSDRKSKQMAKAAKEKMSQLSERMSWHRQGCEACKQ
ncbi:hypothetical protein MYX77_13405, partial [Acidobacteriia bacterium AH_259_A11_L15]|nr:hypothetical protein [Acidobacteriia bacterium AH_259_A11_L15]